MKTSPVARPVRPVLASRLRALLLAGAAALALAACTGDDGPGPGAKAMKALSPKTVALIHDKGMAQDSPIVVRIYKEESELEVWKETTSGTYALLKTYPICRWSGELGPKVKEGDRQAPEGFYTITPGQMNANSSYYLAFDLGFPNAYDRAWGRTGANLMVHGDCSSSGCYAMTDEQVQEIFALGRESFRGGQRSFQVQAYPFRMTSDNLVRHRNNPNLAFWKMLKEGSDVFEITGRPPKVGFCGKRYVFNAEGPEGARFEASAPCPAYTRPEGLEAEVAARKAQDETKLASAGAAPTAPVKTGKDGGMHKVFLAKLQNPELKAPGSLPPVVKPPGSDYGVATNAPAPADSIALATADAVPVAANVPLPEPRPADAPAATAVAATPAGGTLASASSALGGVGAIFGRSSAGPAAATPPTAQVASLDEGGGVSSSFLGSVSRFFGRSESAPQEAPASTSAAPAAPVATPAAGSAAAPASGSAASVAPAAAVEAPAASGSTGLSAITGWLTGRSAAPAPAPAAAPVVDAEAADVPVPPVRPPVPRVSAAPKPATAAPATGAVSAPDAAPALRPSVAASGTPAGGAVLPGSSSILSTGGFSSVQ